MATKNLLKYLCTRVSPILFFRIAHTEAGEMSPKKTRMRYFLNNLPEYDGGKGLPDAAVLKIELISKADTCATKHLKAKTDGGLYVGSAGIGYMFYHISKSPEFTAEKIELLAKSQDIINVNLENASKAQKKNSPSDEVAFLLGNAGVNAVAAAVYHAQGNDAEAEKHLDSYKNIAQVCANLNYTKYGDELFVGRAGYICGALWLNKEFGAKVIPEDLIEKVCITLVESGKKYSKKRGMRCPLMYAYYGTEYLGAAHGLCSILLMLISCESFLSKHPDVENSIKESVDYLLSLQCPDGNFPCALDELGSNARSEGDQLIHWCHGAPGTVYLMAKAYLRWKENKYLNSAIRCGEVTWKKGLLRKGPGICHGVAGSGYVFLLLYRLTGDHMHLYRANEFAKFMLTNTEFLKEARTPDSPYSLFEGHAGSVCFLTDLLNPSSASFPFMDVF